MKLYCLLAGISLLFATQTSYAASYAGYTAPMTAGFVQIQKSGEACGDCYSIVEFDNPTETRWVLVRVGGGKIMYRTQSSGWFHVASFTGRTIVNVGFSKNPTYADLIHFTFNYTDPFGAIISVRRNITVPGWGSVTGVGWAYTYTDRTGPLPAFEHRYRTTIPASATSFAFGMSLFGQPSEFIVRP